MLGLTSCPCVDNFLFVERLYMKQKKYRHQGNLVSQCFCFVHTNCWVWFVGKGMGLGGGRVGFDGSSNQSLNMWPVFRKTTVLPSCKRNSYNWATTISVRGTMSYIFMNTDFFLKPSFAEAALVFACHCLNQQVTLVGVNCTTAEANCGPDSLKGRSVLNVVQRNTTLHGLSVWLEVVRACQGSFFRRGKAL